MIAKVEPDEIRQVRRELNVWAFKQGDEVRWKCGIIIRNLAYLVQNPDNLPLRIQTMKNVEELARACR